LTIKSQNIGDKCLVQYMFSFGFIKVILFEYHVLLYNMSDVKWTSLFIKTFS